MPVAAKMEQASPSAGAARWLWAVGITFGVFAARCREIARYSGDVPYLDQWWVEAHQILVPWLQGKLSWTDFFQSHHEHTPFWTRLMAWLEAALLGRWDPQLQCTINAALFGITIAIASDWLRRRFTLVPALVLTGLMVALAALPHGWENSTWGFQSLVPLALCFGICHIAGSFEAKFNSPGWWLAQASGLAILFTFGSMWMAPAAVVIVALWTAASGKLRWLPPALLAVTGIILLIVARANQPHSGAFVLSASSPQQFIAAFLLQLGWPSQLTGVAALIYFPTFVLALKLRRNARAENTDRILLALAVWSAAQAAAFAYGRGSYLGFVSRYGDLLAVGVVANAIALWRLFQNRSPWRLPVALAAIAWVTIFTQGIKWVSTRAHTEYFHEHAPVWTALRHEAVRSYLAKHDLTALSPEPVRSVLYPDPAIVAADLDTPGLADLLPVSVRITKGRRRGDFISAIAFHVRDQWPMLAASGALLLLLGASLTARLNQSPTPSSPAKVPDNGRLPLLAALTAITGGLVFLWPMPLEFHPEKRWGRMIIPPGAVKDLGFRITTPTTYQVDNLTGGVALWPENFRNVFFGTHIDGPAFTGRAESSPFPIKSPWLVVPITGFPTTPGNGLRIKIETPDGHGITEIPCELPNPPDIDFWGVDVHSYEGQMGRLVFYDGHNDAEGWVGAAPPQPAQDGRLAARLHRSWVLERTTSGHDGMGVFFLSLLVPTLCGSAAVVYRSRKIKHRAARAAGA